MKHGGFLIAAALSGLSACASSPEPLAERNPAYADVSYSNVLVFAEAPDREWRESIESRLVDELTAIGVTAMPAFALPRGTAEATDAEAVIVITVSDTGVREEWVEQQAMSSPLSSNTLVAFSGSVSGSFGGATPAQCKTRAVGGEGYAAKVPWAVIAVSVVDRGARETVWKSAVEFEGEANSDFEDLRRAYARTIARKMAREGLW